VKKAA
jgi:hypothetical protein